MSSSNSSLHPWAAIALTLGGQVPTSGVGFYPGSIQGGGWKAAPATQGLVVDPDFAFRCRIELNTIEMYILN